MSPPPSRGRRWGAFIRVGESRVELRNHGGHLTARLPKRLSNFPRRLIIPLGLSGLEALCRQPRNASFENFRGPPRVSAEISAISTDRSPGLRTRQTFGSALMEYFASLRVARCVKRLLGEQFFQFANPALEEAEGGLNGRRRTHVTPASASVSIGNLLAPLFRKPM